MGAELLHADKRAGGSTDEAYSCGVESAAWMTATNWKGESLQRLQSNLRYLEKLRKTTKT